MQVTINPEYLKRFRDALSSLGIGQSERILLAVSGGPDSIALLLLSSQALAGRINAVTVDHKLRAEAEDEARFVSEICAQLDVPHDVLSPVQEISGNIQSAARSARYALLQQAADDYLCPMIATAHHGDDQLETMLMRLARGSGVDGLAAIRHKNGRIVRPLLGFSKSELEEICVAAGIEPVRDPSNDNPDFDRVRFRQWLAQTRHPFQIARVSRSATALGDAAEALAWMTATLAATRISIESDIIQCDAGDIPRELARRLLIHCLLLIAPELQTKGEAIDHLLEQLQAGQSATIGNILCRGGPVWGFSAAPPRRFTH